MNYLKPGLWPKEVEADKPAVTGSVPKEGRHWKS